MNLQVRELSPEHKTTAPATNSALGCGIFQINGFDHYYHVPALDLVDAIGKDLDSAIEGARGVGRAMLIASTSLGEPRKLPGEHAKFYPGQFAACIALKLRGFVPMAQGYNNGTGHTQSHNVLWVLVLNPMPSDKLYKTEG